jgi:hypothetical protein
MAGRAADSTVVAEAQKLYDAAVRAAAGWAKKVDAHAEHVRRMGHQELRAYAKARGLDAKGTKEDLVARIVSSGAIDSLHTAA